MKLILSFVFCFFALDIYPQATCEFYFFQNVLDTPDLDLSHLRIKMGVNVNGGFLRAGIKDTIWNKFMTIEDDSIIIPFKSRMQKKFNNNLDTNAVVMLDIETPMTPSVLGTITDTLLMDSMITYGFKRRIDIARKILPNARLGMYGIIIPYATGVIPPGQLKGLLRAKQLGMFDSLDFICPVLYPRRQSTEDANGGYAKAIRNAIVYLADSLNCGKDIVPLLSTIISNNPNNTAFKDKWLYAERAQQFVDSLQQFPPISAIAYWTLNPYDPDSNQLQWQSRRDSLESYFSDSISLLPVAEFGYSQNNNQCSFTESSLNATGWYWNFGDGSTSVLKSPPPHFYTANGTYTVMCVVTNYGYCPDTSVAIITVTSITTGMIDNYFSKNSITIYPNPSAGDVTIKYNDYMPEEVYEINIYDLMGKSIKAFTQIDKPEYVLSTTEFPKGIYFLSLKNSKSNSAIEKLTVQ